MPNASAGRASGTYNLTLKAGEAAPARELQAHNHEPMWQPALPDALRDHYHLFQSNLAVAGSKRTNSSTSRTERARDGL